MTAHAQRRMTTTAGDPVPELQYPKAFANAYAPTLCDKAVPIPTSERRDSRE